MNTTIETFNTTIHKLVSDYGDVAPGEKGYLFTTENPDFFHNLDTRGKDCLYVGAGGGDPAFYALANGAKNMDIFDNSMLALTLIAIKKYLITTLNHKEFINLWGGETIFKSLKPLERKNFTPPENAPEIIKKFCNTPSILSTSTGYYRLYDNPYIKNKSVYNKLSTSLHTSNEKLIYSDIEDIDQNVGNKKYDIIYLSTLLIPYNKLENFYNLLKQDGKIYCDYTYNNNNKYSILSHTYIDHHKNLFNVEEISFRANKYRDSHKKDIIFCYHKQKTL
ncbi:MAG: hypothetical protein LBL75_00060 [Rickettsiales bacterium]|jgi:hypothetical protein|nr:hypothetical protein [Rickettsiales bacterium]